MHRFHLAIIWNPLPQRDLPSIGGSAHKFLLFRISHSGDSDIDFLEGGHWGMHESIELLILKPSQSLTAAASFASNKVVTKSIV